jgi:hypothetical protein
MGGPPLPPGRREIRHGEDDLCYRDVSSSVVGRATSAAGPQAPMGLASGGGAATPTPISFSPMRMTTGGGLVA